MIRINGTGTGRNLPRLAADAVRSNIMLTTIDPVRAFDDAIRHFAEHGVRTSPGSERIILM
jgi:hypothetical protein